jgi:hypothetical protein
MKDLIKSRINELQSDVDRVKTDLQSLKESVKGKAQAEDLQKLDELTRELLTYKAGQAELMNLLQSEL